MDPASPETLNLTVAVVALLVSVLGTRIAWMQYALQRGPLGRAARLRRLWTWTAIAAVLLLGGWAGLAFFIPGLRSTTVSWAALAALILLGVLTSLRYRRLRHSPPTTTVEAAAPDRSADETDAEAVIGIRHTHPPVHTSRVTWPHLQGRLPQSAGSRLERPADTALATGPTTGTTVLVGMAGVGKTQIAAAHAHREWTGGALDLLLWVPASSRDDILSAYARAAADITGVEDTDSAAAAERLLGWLAKPHGRRWLIVFDDVSTPGDLTGLWPPDSPQGRVLVTTRRRDSAWEGPGRDLVDVAAFTREEALAYLHSKLPSARRRAEAAEMAADLGRLPLALAQAVAYIEDRNLTCAGYRKRFADRRKRLGELVPEGDALPDEHIASIAVTWSLSIERADRLRPAGLARPLLELAALLDSHGAPIELFTGLKITRAADEQGALGAEDIGDALRNLHRLHLADVEETSVRVHSLVQRAVREQLAPADVARLAVTAANALLAIWPRDETRPEDTQLLRLNTVALHHHTGDALLTPHAHEVLFRAGRSFGEAGRFDTAVRYYEVLDAHIRKVLGELHRQSLHARTNLALWRGRSGNVAAAVEELTLLVADQTARFGADKWHTMLSRVTLAHWQGEKGDKAGAIAALEAVLADVVRVFGPRSHQAMACRMHVATWRGRAGDPHGAVAAFEALLADQTRVYGAENGLTLASRTKLADWRGKAGDFAGAIADYEHLIADLTEHFGPKGHYTLLNRAGLARWRGTAGDPERAVKEYEELLADQRQILGADHPATLATRASLAEWRGRGGTPTAAVRDLADLLADHVRIGGPEHRLSLTTRSRLAHWKSRAGREVEAAADLEELLADQIRLFGADYPRTFGTRAELASCYGRAGRHDDAVGLLRDLLADQIRVNGTDQLVNLKTRSAIAHWVEKGDDAQKAVAEYEVLAEECTRLLGPDARKTLGARSRLANWRGKNGESTTAATELAAVLTDQLRVLGPDHTDTRTVCSMLAYWCRTMTDGAAVLKLLPALLNGRERILGPDHTYSLNTAWQLATLCDDQDDPERAIAVYRTVLRDRERDFGAEHPNTIRTRTTLAQRIGLAGDPLTAWWMLVRAREDRLGIPGPLSRAILKTDKALVFWSHQLDDHDKTVTSYEALVGDLTSIHGPDHPQTLGARAGYANWVLRSGRPELAEPMLTALLDDQLRIMGPDGRHGFGTRESLARLAALRNPVEGRALLEGVLADRTRVLGRDHADTVALRAELNGGA